METNILARGCSKIFSDNNDVHFCNVHPGSKLDVFNWLKDIPEGLAVLDVVEVRFKNTRKAFYRNASGFALVEGDLVAVEASPGHDIGIVSLTGELIIEQLRRNNINPLTYEFKKVYRKAKANDLEKWYEAISLEDATMLKARRIAENLKLNMKIGDVEYQGDRTKAIFYYIADDRVDFRELIKLLAESFRIRIEMKQIGARQEAGRIGGIGSCGRELCCSTWMSNFNSVSTGAARYQELSLNPQKLAGQCSKLKCCLNYELDTYLDERADFPDTTKLIDTTDGTLFHQKTDVFRRMMWYSNKDNPAIFIPISVDKVKEYLAINRAGKKASMGNNTAIPEPPKSPDFRNDVGQDSLTRFDDKKKRFKKKNRIFPKRGGNDVAENKNPIQ